MNKKALTLNLKNVSQHIFSCWKSAIETLEKDAKYVQSYQKGHHWRCSGVFTVNFEQISHIFVFILLT